MVKRLDEINRTAVFAWSPGQQAPIIAAGTAAGALDDSFSNASELELFRLDLSSPSNCIESAGKIASPSRFNKLVWGNVSSSNPYGIIAGGLENGELSLWDPSKIIDGKSDEEAKILSNPTHTGQIRGLDFNKFQHNLLASAGSNNEVYIWDLTKPDTPYTPGQKSQKLDDITSVGWNGQVQHILATSSSTGHTVVWDLRNRKEVMTLSAPNTGGINAGRRSISSVVWHPDVATQLVTASEDDSNPVVTLWDLRHAHSPEKTLAGHSKGVLGVSWCRQDSDLLMSCGKDCKTLIWNPNSGELLGELAQDTNWTFQTEWCPRNPDLLASASFDGKIGVYSLQNSAANDSEESSKSAAQAITDDDPFSAALNAASANTNASSSSAFALRHPPKWLRCPVGATFGFGGKLVSFNNKAGQAATQAAAALPPGQAPAPQSVPRTVHINAIVTDKDTVQRAVELETALEQQSVEQLVEDRVQQAAEKDEKESWEVIKTLLAADAREQLMNYLGFQKSEVIAAVAKATAGKKGLKEEQEESTTAAAAEITDEAVQEPLSENKEESKEESKDEPATATTATTKEEGEAILEHKESKPDEADHSASGLFSGDDAGDDFLIQTDNNAAEQSTETDQDDGGISAAAAAANALKSAISHEPLQLYAEGSSETERLITRAVVLGDFESAVNVCLSTDRLSDALLFAICGGGDLLVRTQQAYFKRQSKSNSYLRLLESIIDEDLNSIVASVSLEEWTSVIVVLCTFAKAEDFRPLCEALGARLEEGWSSSTESENAKEFRRHATLCYLAAGNLEKVSRIWIAEQEEEVQQENAAENVKATSLQHLIEKVTIFRKVISFEDPDLYETSDSKMSYEYPLSPLYDKYCEYAELLAEQGKLTTALTYLSLTPLVYRKATFDKLSVVRDRVYQACPVSVASQFTQPAIPFESKGITTKAAAFAAENQAQQQAQTQQHAYNQPSQYQQLQSAYPSYQPSAVAQQQQTSYAPVRSPLATNSYAPISNSYAPTASTTTSNYTATNAYTPTTAPTTNSYAPTTATGAPTNTYAPQATSATASAASPSYGYNQPNYGGYNNTDAYGSNGQYNNNYGATAATTARPTIPAPPPIAGIAPVARSQSQEASTPPKKPEGAWNDPPMSIAAAANAKKMKSPKMASTPTKRVTSPFPNQPSSTSFVGSPHNQHQPLHQQQQSALPPPPQGAFPPPPMSRGHVSQQGSHLPPPPQGPPRAGMMHPPPPQQQQQQQQQQQAPPPQQFQQQYQQRPMAPPQGMMGGPPPMGMAPPRNNPLPPPPMNAAAPSPLTKRAPPPPQQGGFYQPQRLN
ncbi:hypothetical protein HMPREF1544_04652 [Mucor circinelloides 1006PhL]|uniref:Protein transport protein SEC31 n=1 Tax=Mucor circinelloides f. circinelloides (strain 1006PhL) TaxID=1220926 RepID=S2JF83_MUCC1|nr:hypothetical protein HMPREF1544_04652 [Mucor circinelloides 1006PhL]